MNKAKIYAVFIVVIFMGGFVWLQNISSVSAQSTGNDKTCLYYEGCKAVNVPIIYQKVPTQFWNGGFPVPLVENAPGDGVSATFNYDILADTKIVTRYDQGEKGLIDSLKYYSTRPSSDVRAIPNAEGTEFIINVLLGAGKIGNLPKNNNLTVAAGPASVYTPDYVKYMKELESRLSNPDLMFITYSGMPPKLKEEAVTPISNLIKDGLVGMRAGRWIQKENREFYNDFAFGGINLLQADKPIAGSSFSPASLVIKSKSNGTIYGGLVFISRFNGNPSVTPFVFGDGLPPYGKSANITPWSGASEVKDIADIAANGYTFKQGIDTSNVKDTANDQFSYSIGGLSPKNGSLPIAGTSPRVNDSYVFKPTTRGTWSRTISAVAPNAPYASIGEAKTQILTVRGWKVSGTTQVFLEDGVSPVPPFGVHSGQKVTFIHKISNVGEDINKSATHVAINLDVQGTGQTNGNVDCVVSSGLAYGASDAACRQTVTVTSDSLDSNGKYCQSVSYSQATDNDQKPTSSAPACVIILRG